MLPDSEYNLPGYQTFLLPQVEGTRGLATFVRNTIPAEVVARPPDCWEGNEVLGVKIHKRSEEIVLYVYRKPNIDFTAGELFSTTYQEKVVIGGDFNAHHPTINPNVNQANPTGTHIATLLDKMPENTLITEAEATHVRGGTLDLTFVSTNLTPNVHWNLHPTLTSDHFAVHITLFNLEPASVPMPLPKWNVKKKDWEVFQQELDTWSRNYEAPINIHEAETHLV
ncbi:hypothetical protein E2C01_064618 [Portunus trituberculatus]|uniref:Endonuclease/exonuclease/phosphatase domain-containing protein n=1 Tax=Portunus trituberculatus TaxID=210409 RepID=A0A5B7HGL9_PORTR|nr:hypothetical protein [Portunus trituberculatus]